MKPEEFNELIRRADAISIDDSGYITTWEYTCKRDEDGGILDIHFRCKWLEYDQEYETIFNESSIEDAVVRQDKLALVDMNHCEVEMSFWKVESLLGRDYYRHDEIQWKKRKG